MKKLLSMMALSLLCLFMGSCDDNDISVSDIPAQVLNSFNEKYPGISVQWEKDVNSYKAEFRLNGKDADAWFSTNGDWVRTEVDILKTDLPQVVVDAVQKAYEGYVIDDADWIETPSQNYYDVDIEKGGSADIHVHVTTDGTILKN